MNRYLIKGVCLLVAGLMIASCHDKFIEYTNTGTQKIKDFEEGFKNAFTSNINPDQTWGFKDGSQDTVATTRAEINDEPTGGIVIEEQTDLKEKATTTFTEYFKKRTLLQYGRVFCEDLSGNYTSNKNDFDYNDVVFDAYLWKEELWKKITVVNTYEVRAYQIETRTESEVQYNDTIYNKDLSSKRNILAKEVEYMKVGDDSTKFYTDICYLACGSTKSIKVGGNDATEVHQALGGYSIDIYINAFDKHTEREGGSGYHEVTEPVTNEHIDITKYVRDNGNFSNPTINDIPIFVQLSTNIAANITAKQGEVPQKFMLSSKARWASELCFLGNAYPEFANWAESDEAFLNTSVQGDDYLYNNYPGPDAGLDFNVETGDATTTCLEILEERTDKVTEANEDLVIYELYDDDGEYVKTLPGEPKQSEQQGGTTPDDGGSSDSGPTITKLWSGNYIFDGWTNTPITFHLSNGKYEEGQILRIYLTYNPYYDKSNYDLEINHANWEGKILQYSVPASSTYIEYTLTSSDAEKLAANKAILITAECCIITKIELENKTTQ